MLSYTPAQIQAAYGFNNILYGSVQGTGAGQTVAIIDEGDDANFVDSSDPNFSKSDLAVFDADYGLPNPPSFKVIGEDGGARPTYANASDNDVDYGETAGDVEWVHALAPAANIVLIEMTNATNSDRNRALTLAVPASGADVVSMSFGGLQQAQSASSVTSATVTITSAKETGNKVTITTNSPLGVGDDSKVTIAGLAVSGYDGVFSVTSVSGSTFTYTDPTAGLAASTSGTATLPLLSDGLFTQPGVTYVASSGDRGAPGLYPADSPNVLSVGATNLAADSDGNYLGETAWSNPSNIVSASETGDVVTITTQNSTGALVGNHVTIANCPVAGYDGEFTVSAVQSATSFSYVNANATGLANSSGGATLAGSFSATDQATELSPPVQIIDDSSGSGFSKSSGWTKFTTVGYDGESLSAPGGSAAKATWTFDVPVGVKEGISLSWVAAAGNATNAQYVINNGSTNYTETVNQTVAPNDNTGASYAPSNTPFQQVIQEVTSTTGVITVTLDASKANGAVSADAIAVSSDSNPGGTGGGISQYEPQPAYQAGLVVHNGNTVISSDGMRTTPDVSFIGGSGQAVDIVNSAASLFAGTKSTFAGTSLAAPCWAALIAVIDQGRAVSGLGSLTGSTQTLPMLYKLPSYAFNDITTGFNGYNAGPGYDLVTGLGSPKAPLVAAGLGGVVATGGFTVATHAGVTSSLQTVATFENPAQFAVTTTINWGDGTPVTAGTIVGPNADGLYQLQGSHNYAQTGTHAITATISFGGAAGATVASTADVTPRDVSYNVAQIRAAYGINSIPNFGSATPDGTGQTIAIVDIGDDPNLLTDLDSFDQAMSLTAASSQTLYQQYGAASALVTVYNQAGANITASISNSGTGGVPGLASDGEEALDVEWAHALAPGAKLDLIETDTQHKDDLYTGVTTAANLPGVSVVSMSFGADESNSDELALDTSTFVTPPGHTGITYLGAAGDGGAPGSYPADSPNVVAVGGTSLYLSDGTYSSETGWSFPPPRAALANGSSAYSQAGAWVPAFGGYSGTISAAAGGSASTASWTTPITSADQGWRSGTEVSATWVANSANATNATYQIYDGSAATGKLLGTVTVDQTKAPVGTAYGNAQFQDLGSFYPTSGNLTVVLKASPANGRVVADAIGIAPSSAGGGGVENSQELEPSYQLPFQSSGFRTTPDVSFVGNPATGVDLYYTPSNPPAAGGLTHGSGGTSLSAPCWAALIAIANQGRVAASGTTLDSPGDPQQTLQALYSLPSGDFHDITKGYNGNSASPGYDEVTGRGSPVANTLIPDLVNFSLARPSVALTSTANPSVFGQPVTVTMTIGPAAAGDPTPTGTVLFTNTYGGGTQIWGTETYSVANGKFIATVQLTSPLAPGSNVIQATYSGDHFYSSVTSTLSQLVNPVAPAAKLTSSLNPSTYGQAVTVTMTLGPAFAGAPTPTGSVLFTNTYGAGTQTWGTVAYSQANGNLLATVHLTSPLAGGTNLITATYSGDDFYYAPLTLTLSQVVSRQATKTAVNTSPNPTVAGQSALLSATVTAVNPTLGTVLPTGQVKFMDGTSVLGSVPLADIGGVATAKFSVASLPVGNNPITAIYDGDFNYLSSTSPDPELIVLAANQASSSAIAQSFAVTANPTGGTTVKRAQSTDAVFARNPDFSS